MKTVAKYAEVKWVERKSRFIGRAAPVETEEQALAFIGETRMKHRDASHNVFAYITDGGARVRCSDDGEPSGTAGFPVLDVLRKQNLTNVCAVVTRYFGGILLGAGGLVRAYAKAASLAVEDACVVERLPHKKMSVIVPYADFDKIRYALQQKGFNISNVDYALDVSFSLLAKTSEINDLTSYIVEITNGVALIDVEKTDIII